MVRALLEVLLSLLFALAAPDSVSSIPSRSDHHAICFWRDRGMRLLSCHSDTGMLFEKASELVRELSQT